MKLLGTFAGFLIITGIWIVPSATARHGCGCGHHVPIPPPPYNGPGDTHGPPSSPTTPAPTGPGPTNPSTPPGPGNPRPVSSPRAPVTGLSWEQAIGGWEMWWGFNRTAYLDLKYQVLASGARTGSDDFFLGHGTRQAQATRAITDAELHGRIGPALWTAAKRDPDDQVRGAAMVALAKLARVHTEEECRAQRELFERNLDHPNQAVVECAIVALGLLGDPESAIVLCELADDGVLGRELLRRERVPGRTRALAALSLGLIGSRCEHLEIRRHVVFTLARILEQERAGAADLAVACVTSLGLIRLPDADPPLDEQELRDSSPETSRETQIRFLCAQLSDPAVREIVRAHVPKALASLVRDVDDPQKAVVARTMLRLLDRHQKVERLVRHGLVFGLGMIGDSDGDAIDAEIREALRDAVRDGQVFQQRITLVALALVSGRRGAGAGDPFEGSRETRAFLLQRLSRGPGRGRPWAALALGLQSFHETEADRGLSSGVASALRSRLASTRSPSDVGALCIALGLSGDPGAAPLLLEALNDANGEDARAHAALALGLLDAREAIPSLKAVVEGSPGQPTLLREASIALALLGDKRVVDLLTEQLRESDSDFTRTAVTNALGYVGDDRAVNPLIELLADQSHSSSARRFAAVALGMVGEHERAPWTSLFANHLNYAAVTETLVSGEGGGILNRR